MYTHSFDLHMNPDLVQLLTILKLLYPAKPPTLSQLLIYTQYLTSDNFFCGKTFLHSVCLTKATVSSSRAASITNLCGYSMTEKIQEQEKYIFCYIFKFLLLFPL